MNESDLPECSVESRLHPADVSFSISSEDPSCTPEDMQGRAAEGAGTTVAMSVARRFVEIIEQMGLPLEPVLSAIGIDRDALDDSEARICRLRLERACELSLRPPHGIPALGLRWAERETERTFEPVSYLLAHAATLRQAFEFIARFERVLSDEPTCVLSTEAGRGIVRAVRRPGRSPNMQRLAGELAVNGFLGLVEAYGGETSIERVCFHYPAPEYHSEYRHVLGHAVHFDQPFTGVVFDAAVLDRRLSTSDPDICTALTSVVERRLLRTTRRAPYALRVRDLLTRRMPERIGMSTAARQLALSPRSLRARLADEGTSYGDVQRAVLRSFAESLIRDRGLSIQEAAYAMGFSGADTFHRAFKRWTGATPNEFCPSRP